MSRIFEEDGVKYTFTDSCNVIYNKNLFFYFNKDEYILGLNENNQIIFSNKEGRKKLIIRTSDETDMYIFKSLMK